MTGRERLRAVLSVAETAEHGYLISGRPIPGHLAGIRRILDVPGVGDGCQMCTDAAERAAQAEDKTAAGLARLGLDQPLTDDDPWGA